MCSCRLGKKDAARLILSTRRRLSTLSRVAVDDTTAMIVGRPYWRYPLAVAKPEPSMRPLIEASPFRSRCPS